MLETNVSWFKKELASFTQVHSLYTLRAPGKAPSGATIPAPVYTSLTVDGVPAYWLGRTPGSTPISARGTADYPSQISATKHGYVVILTSTGLSEAQEAKALGIMLRRL